MRRLSVSMALTTVLVAGLFVAFGCDGQLPQLPQPPLQAHLISDIPLKVVTANGSGCESEKPEDIGCTTLCKPCVTFICVEGEWERLDIDYPDGLCDPPNLPDPPPLSGCPRTAEGFCPAECSFCF